jgi:hypothetical protein
MSKIPTAEQLDAADEYANSQLCVEIPSKYGRNLTTWDSKTNQCKITQTGCTASPSNPISLDSFDVNGNILRWEQLPASVNLKKFWSIVPPQHLVWKKTTASPNTPVCARANYKLQQFCEFPIQRTSKNADAFGEYTDKGYVTAQPPFSYTVIDGHETCIIGKNYCDAKGVSYDSVKGECYVSGSQQVGETLLSTYLLRESQKSGYYKP